MVSLRFRILRDSMQIGARSESQEYSESKVIRPLLRSHADQCEIGKITFRVRCAFNRLRHLLCQPIYAGDYFVAESCPLGRSEEPSQFPLTYCGHVRKASKGRGEMANTWKNRPQIFCAGHRIGKFIENHHVHARIALIVGRSCCFEDRGSETQSGSKFGSNKGFYQLLFA
jgi:hypothetical protein